MLSSRFWNLLRSANAARLFAATLATAAIFMFAASSLAGAVVLDTWNDGTDSDPAGPPWSENGADPDFDGDRESAWYKGGGGTLDPVGLGGPERGTVTTSSSSWTTYFSPEGSEVNLANIGDRMCVTWVFTIGTISTTTNGSQNFRIGVMNSPALARVNADSTPGGATYDGYAVFANGGPTLGRNDPFELVERGVGTAGLIDTTADWTVPAQTENANTGDSGYVAGTEYTFHMEITHNASNNIDISASMTGGTLNNSLGLLTTATNLPPNHGSFKFDTFALRFSNALTTSSQFDTSLFKVEKKSIIPEPASFLLFGMGGLALIAWRRRK